MNRPRVGDVVAIPVDGVRFGAMIYLPKSAFGDTWGLFRGIWSLAEMSRKGWAPSKIAAPVFVSKMFLRDAGWRCVSCRPDLVDGFDTPSSLHAPPPLFGRPALIRPHQLVSILEEQFLTDVERARLSNHTSVVSEVSRGERATPPDVASVNALKERRFFDSWKGFAPPAVIAKAEAAVQEAIASIEGRAPAAAADRLAVLVRTFNRLDDGKSFVVGSLERDTIMEALRTIASACGIEDSVFDEIVDGAREF